jgi:glutamate-1-semialdehyde 2,1-aminomutase
MIQRGIIAPSFVVSYAHAEEDIDLTIEITKEALRVYKRALNDGVEAYLKGPPVQPTFRKYNGNVQTEKGK